MAEQTPSWTARADTDDWAPGVSSASATLLAVCAARCLAVAAHEAVHALTAMAFGFEASITLSLGESSTHVRGIASSRPSAATIVRHAGWLFSVALAVAASASGVASSAVAGTLWLTAFDGAVSDVLCFGGGDRFFCGNFGLLLLNAAQSGQVCSFIRRMIEVTMQRGAQSAGLVTYSPAPNGGGAIGSRFRVVNGKRTNLSSLLMRKAKRALDARNVRSPQLFQGVRRCTSGSNQTHARQQLHAPTRSLRQGWRADGKAVRAERMSPIAATSARAIHTPRALPCLPPRYSHT